MTIDPTRQSEFASQILAMLVEEIEPTFVEMDSDYRIIEFAPGVICTMHRTRSMICSHSPFLLMLEQKQTSNSDWRPP